MPTWKKRENIVTAVTVLACAVYLVAAAVQDHPRPATTTLAARTAPPR